MVANGSVSRFAGGDGCVSSRVLGRGSAGQVLQTVLLCANKIASSSSSFFEVLVEIVVS